MGPRRQRDREFSPWSLISNFTVVAVEDNQRLPSTNFEDMLILTALPAVGGLATQRSPEVQDASPSIVTKSDQISASEDSDKPQTHNSLLGAHGIAIVSDELQLSVQAMSMVENQESGWTEYELERSLIDQIMSASNIEWCS